MCCQNGGLKKTKRRGINTEDSGLWRKNKTFFPHIFPSIYTFTLYRLSDLAPILVLYFSSFFLHCKAHWIVRRTKLKWLLSETKVIYTSVSQSDFFNCNSKICLYDATCKSLGHISIFAILVTPNLVCNMDKKTYTP